MKIKKERKQIGGAWVDLEIHYDTKLRHFHMKGLPSDFATFSPSWKNGERASTEKELSDHYYTCSREYVKNKESRKKVIIFIASASSQLTMNKVGTGSYSGSKSKKLARLQRSPSGAMDYEMGFEFGIYTEIDENGKKSYFEHLTGLDNNETGEVRQWPARLNSEHTVIPYSDTAYQFFLNLAAGFEKMVHQLAEFFGEEDGQKVISFIQSHPKLLGSGQ